MRQHIAEVETAMEGLSYPELRTLHQAKVAEVRECRDPRRVSELREQSMAIMQKVTDTRPPDDPADDIADLRQNGQADAAWAMENTIARRGARERLEAAEQRLNTAREWERTRAERELREAEQALAALDDVTPPHLAAQTAREEAIKSADAKLAQSEGLLKAGRADLREQGKKLKAEAMQERVNADLIPRGSRAYESGISG